MTNATLVAPRTLDTIKSDAKRIGAEAGIAHGEALNLAATRYGFNNFTHARRCYAEGVHQQTTFLTCYWIDRKNRAAAGRETLTVILRRPVSGMLTRAEITRVRQLANFKLVAEDHLQYALVSRSQGLARVSLIKAMRVLQFIDATLLRPASRKGFRHAYPDGSSANRIPGEDHASIWVNGAGALLLADEPYAGRIRDRGTERDAWAAMYDYELQKAPWNGMYNPPEAILHLAASRKGGANLQPILAALEKLAPPATYADWSGASAHYRPMFVSPGGMAKVKPPRPPVDPLEPLPWRKDEVGNGRRYRPRGRMPLEQHIEVANLLNEVKAQCLARSGAANRIGQVINDLDNWVQSEYPKDEEMPNSVFSKLYYGNPHYSTYAREKSAQLNADLKVKLDRVGDLMTAAYPPCKSRDLQLHRLQLAAKSLTAWVAQT